MAASPSTISISPPLRGGILEFLIDASQHLSARPIVKYTALSFFSAFLRTDPTPHPHWLLRPLRYSNLQLFALVSLWLANKIHDSRPLSVKSFKSLGDMVIADQHFTTRDYADAEMVFLEVLRFEIGATDIAFVFLEDLHIQLRSAYSGLHMRICISLSVYSGLQSQICVSRSAYPYLRHRVWRSCIRSKSGSYRMELSKLGELVSFDLCMDIMDLLYETEETSVLFSSPCSLAASIIVTTYLVSVSKQQWEFPILPWVKFATSYEEQEIIGIVREILQHIIKPRTNF